jgi:hypothetical protein
MRPVCAYPSCQHLAPVEESENDPLRVMVPVPLMRCLGVDLKRRDSCGMLPDCGV